METQTIEELDIIIRAKVDDAVKSIDGLVKSLKNKLNDGANTIRNFNKETKNISTNTNSSMINTSNQYNKLKNTIKSTTAQQELLLRKIKDIQATLNDTDLSSMLSKQEVLEMRAELDKLVKQYNNLGNTAEKTANKSSKSFKNLWKVVKRGVLLTLGVESAFSFLRQGMQSAISVNDELASKQEVVRNAIGQIFVPIMLRAYDVVQYLVAGLGLLIKAFTGIDVFAKLTTKNLNNTNKSAKALNKTLSGIDDIDTLSSDSGSISGGIASDLKALNEFREKIAEVQAKFVEWNLYAKIEKIKQVWQDHIKPIFVWFKDNPEVLATFFSIIIGGKLISSISTLLGSASAGTGLLGLAGTLTNLATLSTIAIVVEVATIYTTGKKQIEDAKTAYEVGRYNAEHWGEGINTSDYQDVYDMLQSSEAHAKANKEVMGSTLSSIYSIFDAEYRKDVLSVLGRVAGEMKKSVPLTREMLKNTELTEKEYRNIVDSLGETRDYLEENIDRYKEGTDEWNNINEAIELTNGLINEINRDYLKLWDKYKESGEQKINEVKVAFSNAFEETKTNGEKVFNLLSEKTGINLGAIADNIKTKVGGIFDGFKLETDNLEQDLKNRDFKGAFDNLSTALKGIFDKDYNIKVGASTTNLKTTLSNTFSNVINGISNIFGGLTSATSNKTSLSTLASSVTNWAKNTLKNGIPFFANGNVATSPTLGIFGEYANARSNPEITAPQSILRQTFRDELRNNSNNGTLERLTINLGSEAIFDEFIEYVNNKYSNGVQVFKEA